MNLAKWSDELNDYSEFSNPIEVIIFPEEQEKRKGKCIGNAAGNRHCKYYHQEPSSTVKSTKPTLIATDATASFTGNVVVGEQFIGATSGAVARVVSVVSGTSISFVVK